MKIDKKIWNVESTCDGEHDNQIYFTLSFVTPTVEDPESFNGTITKIDDWHFSYKILIDESTNWNLLYFETNSEELTDVKVKLIDDIKFIDGDIDETNDIRKIFETKLNAAIQNQTNPYSASSLIASRQEPSKSTLPHELAGLNQLPKPLSEFLFEATVTVKFPQAKMDSLTINKVIGLYPTEFVIAGEIFKFVKCEEIRDEKKGRILYTKYTLNGEKTSNQLFFKDIIQGDSDNKPKDKPSEVLTSSEVYLNDPSVSGRLGILARNLNAFRILSASLRLFDHQFEVNASKDNVLNFIYSLLSKGVLREVAYPKPNDQKYFTVFDSTFASNLALDKEKLDELIKNIGDNESTFPTSNWFAMQNNLLYKSWNKFVQKPILINLANLFEDLANESIKNISESSFWVDWLYFVNSNSINTNFSKEDRENIKYLLKQRLEEAHNRDRLILRPFFKKIGENAADVFKREILDFNKAPNQDTIKSSLNEPNKFQPIVSLFSEILQSLNIPNNGSNYESKIIDICCNSLLTTSNQIYNQASALPDDWGISIKLEDKNSKNKDIRGYSIALCSVKPDDNNTILESVWLTNRHVLWQENLEKKFLKDNISNLIVDRPHGGFKSQGEQVLSINYYGDGTGISESDRSNNLNTAIRFVSLDVNEEEKKIDQSIYPKLGYGMYYRSAVTSVLNSGLVVEENFRESKQDIGIYTLKKSSEITYQEEPKQYLCRVKPAAPNIVSLENGCNINEDEDLSRDSLALLVYKKLIDKNEIKNTYTNPPVYLLSQTDNQFWNNKTRSLELTIDRPRTSYNVFERWINTELVYVQKNVDEIYRDPYFKKKSKELNDLLARFPRNSSNQKDISQPPHPAVRAIGIKVFDVTSAQQTEVASNQITIDKYEYYLDKENKLVLKATYTSNLNEKINCDSGVIDISLAPNKIYRICLYSLVPKNLCGGDFVRVQEEVLKSETDKSLVDWNDYYQGAESEFWIECLATETAVDEKVLNGLFGTASVKPTSSLVSLNVAELDPNLTRLFSGLEFEQHKWRWTGYPSEIDITKGDGSQDEQLNLRLMDYWGARSRHYEKIDKDANNQNQLDGHWQVSFDNNNQFIVKPQKLHDWHFKGHHGAHHGVYLLKPRLRYQSLIEESQLRTIKSKINKTSYQNKNVRPFLVNAVLDHNIKLPPLEIAYSAPVLEWDKPSSENNRLVHAGSGVMCVFDEVFYRNDDMGLFGGLAERYEISLVPTRIKGLNQIGPDPVLHPQPNVKKFIKNDKELSAELNLPYLTNNIPVDDYLNQLNWKVEHTPFYGLTKDGGINHKNNQTATILYLTGNFTHQYDILAQVRTRRWLEPTLVEGAEIIPVNTKFFLPKRFVKQDWVPIDYCIFDGKNKRELVSWHKGNWNNTSEEIWRRNIIIQELKTTNNKEYFKWETIAEKTPYEDDFDYKGQSDANQYELPNIYDPLTSNIKVFKWITSDYSDGTWMTFLGAPWRNRSFASRQFGLLYENDGIKIKRSSLGYKNKLEATSEFIVEDLIIHPLADSYYLSEKEKWLEKEKHRFNLLFVYETFKPEDQADSDEKYCKFHSLWHPTRVLNQNTNSPSRLNFVPIDKGTKLKKGKNYIGALYEFFCENINDDITKNIKNYLLGVDQYGKELKDNEKNGMRRLTKLWFPEMQEENTPRPLVIMRPPMMGYMPLFFGENDLNEALKSEVHENIGINKYKIKKNLDKNVYFEIYMNTADSFWEIYKSNNIPKDCSIALATRGSIVENGLDLYCMTPNGNAVIKLKSVDKNPSVEVIQNNKWDTNWAVD